MLTVHVIAPCIARKQHHAQHVLFLRACMTWQVESSRLALERETLQLTATQAQLQTAQQELHEAVHHVTHRLILARWQFAGLAVTLPNPADLVPAMPPDHTGDATSSLVKRTQSLERMTAARAAANQQVQAFKAEQALKKGVASLRKDGTSGDAFSAAVRVRVHDLSPVQLGPACHEHPH